MLVVIKWKFPIDSQRDVIRQGLIAEGTHPFMLLQQLSRKALFFAPESCSHHLTADLLKGYCLHHVQVSGSWWCHSCYILLHLYDSSFYSTTSDYCCQSGQQRKKNKRLIYIFLSQTHQKKQKWSLSWKCLCSFFCKRQHIQIPTALFSHKSNNKVGTHEKVYQLSGRKKRETHEDNSFFMTQNSLSH